MVLTSGLDRAKCNDIETVLLQREKLFITLDEIFLKVNLLPSTDDLGHKDD